MMPAAYLLHILAGAIVLVTGYAALFAAKGGRIHRTAGRVFSYAMLATTLAGFAMAVVRDVAPDINVPAALLTMALVLSGLLSLRDPDAIAIWGERLASVLALGVGVTATTFAIQATLNGGTRNGMPTAAFLLFGVVGLLAVIGDIRVWRIGRPQGRQRIARHLWRMTWALFVAALSFFIGQAKVFPAPIRIMPLLVLPVLTVLLALGYWMWRLRRRPGMRGLSLSRPEAGTP